MFRFFNRSGGVEIRLVKIFCICSSLLWNNTKLIIFKCVICTHISSSDKRCIICGKCMLKNAILSRIQNTNRINSHGFSRNLSCLICSGLLHYKPRNTNLWQYPLAVSSISCAPRKREEVSVGWRETVY